MECATVSVRHNGAHINTCATFVQGGSFVHQMQVRHVSGITECAEAIAYACKLMTVCIDAKACAGSS